MSGMTSEVAGTSSETIITEFFFISEFQDIMESELQVKWRKTLTNNGHRQQRSDSEGHL